jgi:uncharacterized protein (TIGR01244 family)
MSDPTHIHVWRRFDARVTTSGQPTEAELAEIRALGVTYVVNLGLHSHERALPDEAASVAALGMTYIHIPVDFERPTDEDFRRFRVALDAIGDQPVHIHCIANARVSAFLYRHRRDVAGSGAAEAKALMDSIWRPDGVWARFLGDEESAALGHRPPG